MTTPELEQAVVKLLNPRLNAIVPNVSWGLGIRHECDLLVLDSQNRFTEIELKVSKSDLKKDFQKGHGHCCDFISRLVYAVPDYLLEEAIKLVPKHHGIISTYQGHAQARWVRIPRHHPLRRPTPDQVNKFLRLGAIRIWNNVRV